MLVFLKELSIPITHYLIGCSNVTSGVNSATSAGSQYEFRNNNGSVLARTFNCPPFLTLSTTRLILKLMQVTMN
jgi:hypothetical protein